jgi:hypothetical protein
MSFFHPLAPLQPGSMGGPNAMEISYIVAPLQPGNIEGPNAMETSPVAPLQPDSMGVPNAMEISSPIAPLQPGSMESPNAIETSSPEQRWSPDQVLLADIPDSRKDQLLQIRRRSLRKKEITLVRLAHGLYLDENCHVYLHIMHGASDNPRHNKQHVIYNSEPDPTSSPTQTWPISYEDLVCRLISQDW